MANCPLTTDGRHLLDWVLAHNEACELSDNPDIRDTAFFVNALAMLGLSAVDWEEVAERLLH